MDKIEYVKLLMDIFYFDLDRAKDIVYTVFDLMTNDIKTAISEHNLSYERCVTEAIGFVARNSYDNCSCKINKLESLLTTTKNTYYEERYIAEIGFLIKVREYLKPKE